MNALAQEQTRPAFPLGQPVDGRPRYGMTPEQAAVYRWLVNNRPHHKVFRLDFRDAASGLQMGLSTVHHCAKELVDRGWLYESDTKAQTRYGLVHPIMVFNGPRNG